MGIVGGTAILCHVAIHANMRKDLGFCGRQLTNIKGVNIHYIVGSHTMTRE